MFRSLTIYQLTQATPAVLRKIQAMLSDPSNSFTPCTGTMEKSHGFVPPLEEGSDMLYSANGAELFRLRIDEKSIPASAIRDVVNERRDSSTEEWSKTMERIAKDEAKAAFLPHMPAGSTYVSAYIDTTLNMLFVAASEASADEFTAIISKALGGTPFKLLDINADPCDHYTRWVRDPEALGDHFELGHQGALKQPHREGGCGNINAKNEDFDSEEFLSLLDAGREVCSIALEHVDLEFRLTSKIGMRNVNLTEQSASRTVPEGSDEPTRPAEFAEYVLCVRRVMNDLEPLMGGWPKQEMLDLHDEMGDQS